MKIVIEIPEEEYALCKKQWDTECLDTERHLKLSTSTLSTSTSQKARGDMGLIIGLLLIGWFINIIHAYITGDWENPLI